jgi:hypothetical protein
MPDDKALVDCQFGLAPCMYTYVWLLQLWLLWQMGWFVHDPAAIATRGSGLRRMETPQKVSDF